MLKLIDLKSNARFIGCVINSNLSATDAVTIINDFCGLNITVKDLLKLVIVDIEFKSVDVLLNSELMKRGDKLAINTLLKEYLINGDDDLKTEISAIIGE